MIGSNPVYLLKSFLLYICLLGSIYRNKIVSNTRNSLIAPLINLGDVTTVNLTYMSGGVQMNVVPNEFTVGFDIRITPTTNMAEFEAQVSPLYIQ